MFYTEITMQINTVKKIKTHEGGRASILSNEEQLRRSVMSTMLWESGFYENGVDIAQRITDLVKVVDSAKVIEIMIEAKTKNKLRHAPLLILCALTDLHSEHVKSMITRADELSELLAIYWRNGRTPIAKQLKKGLAAAFKKFDEYQLAKYNRSKSIKLKDILRIVHPKPENDIQSDLWKRLLNDELKTPDTWEVALSTGADKKETFERLIQENKLGDLAFLRNLRNMIESGVSEILIKESLQNRKWSKILPFQFITAARYAVKYENQIEFAMMQSLQDFEKINQKVSLLVDVSGSMSSHLAQKSELMRLDAACGLAILLREICSDIQIYTFENKVCEVPARHGFALRYAIGRPRGGTEMWGAIKAVGNDHKSDIMIVITDEQTSDFGRYELSNSKKLFIVNIGNSKKGVGYNENTVHISGWSENVVKYIAEYCKHE